MDVGMQVLDRQVAKLKRTELARRHHRYSDSFSSLKQYSVDRSLEPEAVVKRPFVSTQSKYHIVIVSGSTH